MCRQPPHLVPEENLEHRFQYQYETSASFRTGLTYTSYGLLGLLGLCLLYICCIQPVTFCMRILWNACLDRVAAPLFRCLSCLPCFGWVDSFAETVLGRRYRPLVEDLLPPLPTAATKPPPTPQDQKRVVIGNNTHRLSITTCVEHVIGCYNIQCAVA